MSLLSQSAPNGEFGNKLSKEDLCHKIIAECHPLDHTESGPLREYLKNRGLNPTSDLEQIRFHPRLYCAEIKGYLPALVGVVTDQDNSVTGIHRIYLTPDGRKAPVNMPKMSLGTVMGSGVRLGPSSTQIGISEGIETGLAAHQATGMTVLAALTAGGLEGISLPSHVTQAFIWTDFDTNQRGQVAANKLAAKLHSRGIEAFILTPPMAIPSGKGKIDWLDVLNADPNLISSSLQSAKAWQPGTQKPDTGSNAPGNANPWPERMRREAFHGLLGEIVDLIMPTTEADEAAILLQLIVVFGNLVGRNPYYQVEETRHYLNLFVVLVGQSSRARKGTSWARVRALFVEFLLDFDRRWTSGLASGEALIALLMDAIIKRRKPKKGEEAGKDGFIEEVLHEGVTDKRLLILQQEFSQLLKVTSRPGNTLSDILRNAWDGVKRLENNVKHERATATDAHVSIVGHITFDDLKMLLSRNDAYNGFANRFLWVCVSRSKKLPHGKELDADRMSLLVSRLKDAFEFSTAVERMRMNAEAHELWASVLYDKLTPERSGYFAEMTGRSEAQVVRLACIYALLDRSETIGVEHLLAATSVWQYCEDSCLHICGDLGTDSTARKILEALRTAPNGMTRTQIHALLSGHSPREHTEQVLLSLRNEGLADFEKKPTGGKPVEIWFARH